MHPVVSFPLIISLKNAFYHVIGVHRICEYLTQSIGTAAHVTRREESTPEPRAAGVPVYAVNITYETLHCVHQHETKDEPTSNPQNNGFNHGVPKKIAGFARLIKLRKPVPESKTFAVFDLPSVLSQICVEFLFPKQQ